ncbi:hypothetical protein GE21DRAFT_1211393 [Neurospora crassa]|nr:hypothetical protein GE21DRAFT_1211393 [Neurospora crassa]
MWRNLFGIGGYFLFRVHGKIACLVICQRLDGRFCDWNLGVVGPAKAFIPFFFLFPRSIFVFLFLFLTLCCTSAWHGIAWQDCTAPVVISVSGCFRFFP